LSSRAALHGSFYTNDTRDLPKSTMRIRLVYVPSDVRDFRTCPTRYEITAPTLVMIGRLDAEDILVIDEQAAALIPRLA
jgi:hypothetical protein